ncbi:MAG: aminotransferase class III-fold pyridoxal phosphate-dependent enzyme [Sediminibacterium sp.]|jgi:glutamate-1-semialdehyde 2,1-aminomutase|nr:aminotransferase class III-fold pyridoxal phosphate-dependent enzyme [Sediminibacterium sp.]
MKRDSRRSEAALARCRESIAGGDSSTMRVLPYHPAIVADRGEGAWVFDIDGNRLLDMNMAYGPLLFGHRPEFVVERVTRQLASRGSQLGFPTELTYRVGELVQKLFPSMELMRFANSGTEAIAAAIRLARHTTGRRGLVAFEGHYHGWSEAIFHSYHAPLDQLPAEPGDLAAPGTKGMSGFGDVYLAPWNSVEALIHCLDRREGEIAAVIMEPVMGNASLIPPAEGYLQEVRRITQERGILLIFDEVITGLRIAPGGAQQMYGVTPDITILSKVLGGGFPIAVFGGSRTLLAPIVARELFHGGVYSGNALVLAAAEAMLEHVLAHQDTIYPELESWSRKLCDGMTEVLTHHQIPGFAHNLGSLVGLVLTKEHGETQLDDYRSVRRHGDFETFIDLENIMASRGVYFHPNMFEPMFASTCHTKEDIAYIIDRLADSCAELRQ